MKEEEQKDVVGMMLNRLKRFYLLTTLPTLAFFALFYFVTTEALILDAEVNYYLLVGFFLLALIAVPTSSVLLKRAVRNGAGKSEEEQVVLYEKAYRIRIWVLAGLAYLSGPMYMLTKEDGCLWMFVIAVVVLLLTYPSEQYVLQDRNKQN